MPAQALQYASMSDLIATGLRDLGEPNYTELTTDIQRFHVMHDQLMREKRIINSGYGIQWDIVVSDQGTARAVGAAAQDEVSIKDVAIQGTADWRKTTVSYAFEDAEIAMNRGKRQIVDLLKLRRDTAIISLVQLFESMFWGPPVALADNVTMHGINTWLVKNATAGFTGTVPSGYTTIGNVNPTTYPRWCNYAGPYTDVTQADLIRAVRLMLEKTDWQPPITGLPLTQTGDDWGLYTTLSVRQSAEEIATSSNDNLGSELAKYDGQVTIRRRPLNWIPILDRDSTNPFYSICWGDAKFYVFSDYFMKQTKIVNYPGQHTISAVFMDSIVQFVMKNRRRSGVLSTGTTYPA